MATLTEKQIRSIIQEELTLNEGVWDDAKQGLVKLQKLAKQKLGSTITPAGKKISSTIEQLTLPEDVRNVIKVLNSAMNETGLSLKDDENIKIAKKFGTFTKEKALALANEDLNGPVLNLAKSLQETSRASNLMFEVSIVKQQLNEFAVGSAVGIGLAVLGGLPMLFAGLAKVAKLLRAKKLAHLFEHAYHVTHLFELKTINAVIPNKLSYAVYKMLHKRGLKFANEKTDLLTYDEYVNDVDESDALHKVNGLVYKSVLIYFAFNGISGVLHAGASLLGVVEGAATTVKGIELARGAMEIAALASKSS